MKLDQLIDQYEQSAKLRGLAPTQLNALKPVRRALGLTRPEYISPGVIARYVRSRKAGGYTLAHAKVGAKDGTIRRELGALSAVLNWGKDKRLINDAPTIDLPPPSPPRENFLTKNMADKLWVHAQDANSGCTGLFVCLALDTWARANAIETLTWRRVDFVRNVIDYRDPSKPETSKRRVPVPMSSRLRELLLDEWERSRPGLDELVVGPVTQYAFRKLMDAAGMPADITRHDLRRTGISHAVGRGVDLMKVAQMAGDDYNTIIKHYARFAPDYLDGVVE
jgi:integrase